MGIISAAGNYSDSTMRERSGFAKSETPNMISAKPYKKSLDPGKNV